MTGHLHPLTIITNRVIEYFQRLGFVVELGDEVETVANNFDMLNFPPDHPARDAHDTFYLTDGRLLRTHTSVLQVPLMTRYRPPVRILMPGRVYRDEATDSTHQHTFYQIDAFVIEKEATLASLIGTLEGWMEDLLAKKLEFRFRPSYFPFVEPGLELDIKGPNGRWLEVLGAGMIHPKVLENMGLDAAEDQGWAFGCGLERLLMLVTDIKDIRQLMTNDYRLLGQFS
ncbi:MAG: phenylalanine--tRNA ligase subunit alpha, partial [Patescibacteria group bacterium]